MRFFGRAMGGLFLAAVTLAILALAVGVVVGALRERMAGGPAARPAEERVVSANVIRVETGRIVPVTTAYGELRAVRTLELRAPVGGRVAELSPNFAEGAAVAEGEVLLRLDPAEAMAARDLAAAALAEAEAGGREAGRALTLAREDLAQAEAQLALRAQAVQRQRDIAARGAGSAAAVETAELAEAQAEQALLGSRSALAQAEAAVDQAAITLTRAQIGLGEAERVLGDTVIRAEFAGRLEGVSSVVTGGKVNANEVLGRVIDPAALEVRFRLSTAQYARLVDARGALVAAPVAVRLEVVGADLAAEGRLVRAGASGAEAGGGRVVFAMLDAAPGLRPGDFVTVEVAEPALEAVADLPATAVDAAGRVLAVTEEARLEEVAVEVLRRQGDRVIVAPGALVGREVVAERSPLLGAGIKVRPVRPGVETEAAAGVVLTEARRAALIAAVEGNDRMPEEARARLIEQLRQDVVPAEVVARIEARMGG
ncbi:efflux RND transporter periplasmic adaptor subunit [Fuscovulum ytuae]|uniref:HlyD family efflux transporter periplasmic adaptor subunit n=1 Tax=Fuscovulum ytuae TaxID=3042299 RepID=A0ABY8Q531_9RHOB|nr:HlyD family efflux transporter periplasmic adaptor subunit [Fuscovulum sp. YMD61]WGV15784.1 HlyD family efflux transporter periplasmic adaptor subunit [Fuscovulum sp. YMD61]